jgi:hypothetical protein
MAFLLHVCWYVHVHASSVVRCRNMCLGAHSHANNGRYVRPITHKDGTSERRGHNVPRLLHDPLDTSLSEPV